LFKALPHLPKNLTSGTGKIGVRLPDHEFSRKLIQYIDHPLTASSANLSGCPNSRTAAEIVNLDENINLIIDGGMTTGGKESTVLDTTLTPPKLIREGAISKNQIESILNMELTKA
jgi:L-threonylcarbamoyladenylate synthase